MGAKENILEKIKNAKSKVEGANHNIDLQSEIYAKFDGDLIAEFKSNIENVDGNAYICNSLSELKTEIVKILNTIDVDAVYCIDKGVQELLEEINIPFLSNSDELLDIQIAITSCEYILARTGSVMVSSQSGSGRRLNVYAPYHIVIATENQMVKDLDEAFIKLKKKYGDNLPSLISNITGPSRTADIEKTLIIGAHGPKELTVFILKN